jgi:hypothetical protein
LKRGQPVEAYAEEIGVEVSDHAGSGFENIPILDGAVACEVPDMEAPFLNEYG